jgi:hypothetical protein
VANQWLAVARRFTLTEVFRAETIIIMLDRRRDRGRELPENCPGLLLDSGPSMWKAVLTRLNFHTGVPRLEDGP